MKQNLYFIKGIFLFCLFFSISITSYAQFNDWKEYFTVYGNKYDETKAKELRGKLIEEYNDFDTWAEHGIKQDYSCLIDSKQAPLLRKYFIDDDDYYWDKYTRLYLDDVLDRIDGGNIAEDDIEDLKQELRDLNFGSMEYDW